MTFRPVIVIFTLLACLGLRAEAQGVPNVRTIEGKPSLSETLDYIQKFLNSASEGEVYCNAHTYKDRWMRINATSDGGLFLISRYTLERGWGIESPKSFSSEDYNINLRDVERIELVSGQSLDGVCVLLGLGFVQRGDSGVRMHLPLWRHGFDRDYSDYRSDQIFRAFEHLRQLVGAPEPLKF